MLSSTGVAITKTISPTNNRGIYVRMYEPLVRWKRLTQQSRVVNVFLEFARWTQDAVLTE